MHGERVRIFDSIRDRKQEQKVSKMFSMQVRIVYNSGYNNFVYFCRNIWDDAIATCFFSFHLLLLLLVILKRLIGGLRWGRRRRRRKRRMRWWGKILWKIIFFPSSCFHFFFAFTYLGFGAKLFCCIETSKDGQKGHESRQNPYCSWNITHLIFYFPLAPLGKCFLIRPFLYYFFLSLSLSLSLSLTFTHIARYYEYMCLLCSTGTEGKVGFYCYIGKGESE